MCGIAWYLFDQFSQETMEALKQMSDRISHRGPDGTSTRTLRDGEEGGGRGRGEYWVFHRLAIINPHSSEGMQPFESADGTSRLICNGEIYNFRDLCDRPDELRSDCEVVLRVLDAAAVPHLDAEGVKQAVKSLDGDFAFVWSAGAGKEKEVVIARDHVGVCPLFYGTSTLAADPKELRAVASEAKALLGAPGVSSVHVFPPGHLWFRGAFVKYDDGGEEEDVATLLRPAAPAPAPPPAAVVRALVERAVCRRIQHSERAVGILCSGGVDSSIVASIVASHVEDKDRIRVFTMEYEGARSEDAFYARMLCEKLGLRHTMLSFCREDVLAVLPRVVQALETYDAPTIRAAIPMFLMAHRISKETEVRVILSGEGADELFQGYTYFRKAPDFRAANDEALRLVRNLHMFDLLRAERCFSSAGIEVRVPFLDRDLVAYVQSLDGSVLWGGQRTAEKHLLRTAFAHVDALVSSRIIERPKEKFSDGCGFTYVPQLLADISGEGVASLGDRLTLEKAYVGRIFDAAYPGLRHLVVPRTMPAWTFVTTSSTEGPVDDGCITTGSIDA